MTVRLVDLPQPVLVALHDGDVAVVERAIGLPVPAELVGHTDIWAYMLTLLADRPASAGWTMQALVRDDEIVGNAGFKGAPDEYGEVEIGYLVLTPHRGQGLALTAVRLLLDRALREPTVTRVRAIINPDNTASLGVISRSGFQPDGERVHPRWGRQLRFVRSVQVAH